MPSSRHTGASKLSPRRLPQIPKAEGTPDQRKAYFMGHHGGSSTMMMPLPPRRDGTCFAAAPLKMRELELKDGHTFGG